MMMTYRIRVRSNDAMSNTRYHAAGKPTWWARVGSTFATLPEVRGDEALDHEATLTLPADGLYTLDTGVGPNDRHGIRERDTILAYTLPDGRAKAIYLTGDREAAIRALLAQGQTPDDARRATKTAPTAGQGA